MNTSFRESRRRARPIDVVILACALAAGVAAGCSQPDEETCINPDEAFLEWAQAEIDKAYELGCEYNLLFTNEYDWLDNQKSLPCEWDVDCVENVFHESCLDEVADYEDCDDHSEYCTDNLQLWWYCTNE